MEAANQLSAITMMMGKKKTGMSGKHSAKPKATKRVSTSMEKTGKGPKKTKSMVHPKTSVKGTSGFKKSAK